MRIVTLTEYECTYREQGECLIPMEKLAECCADCIKNEHKREPKIDIALGKIEVRNIIVIGVDHI